MPSSSSIDADLMSRAVTQQRRVASASATDLDLDLDAAAIVPSTPRTGRTGRPKAKRPEDFASFLRTQAEIDAICKEHGVPGDFTARPAGDLRANAAPPPGAVCVYARALEAGMRVPLDGFSSEALAHFGIAPAQLTPNGWRIVAGFVGLCRSLGVRPSLPVFRRLVLLTVVSQRQKKGWYFCRSRNRKRGSSGLRFTGMPSSTCSSFKHWKHEFFFLSSPDPEPWPCPVEWGEPSKCSFRNPVLTGEEKKWAAKLLRAHGGAAVDLRKYVRNNTNLAASLITAPLLLPPPPPPPPSSFAACTTSSPEGNWSVGHRNHSVSPCVLGMDPSVYEMRRTMLAAKAAAQALASAKKVRSEPGSKAARRPPLRGKKRSPKEANDKECLAPSMQLNTALPSVVCSSPPGFPAKPQHLPSRHDGDGTSLVAIQERLEEAKMQLASANGEAEEEKKVKAELAVTRAELAKAEAGLAAAEAEVVKAKAELSAAKLTANAEQEKGMPELTAIEEAKAKLAAAKRALEEEVASAKAAAVHQLLCCEDHVRRRAEHALEGYRRWRTGRAPAGCTAWLAR